MLFNIVANYNSMKDIMMKEIIKMERPRERLISVGVNNISNEDLLSIIIKTGTKNQSVKTLSLKILNEFKGIEGLKNITISNLSKIKGIGIVKAVEIIAAIELGKRVYYNKNIEEIDFSNTRKVYEYFKNILINEQQENFYAVYLNTKNKVISYKLLFKGTINKSCVHPREIFKLAFLESAYSIIVLHNHPSGEVTPSKEDIEVTTSLIKIGKLVGIPVLDHIIIGKNNYYSFYENTNK